ncbi:hypothetical protein AA19596_1075 [Acetobacter fabarum DSM 19596]|jgi:hypothetical protein|nr:hypothetical protein AA19596_1075 [Acetobacter fabarum DSM 19596]
MEEGNTEADPAAAPDKRAYFKKSLRVVTVIPSRSSYEKDQAAGNDAYSRALCGKKYPVSKMLHL